MTPFRSAIFAALVVPFLACGGDGGGSTEPPGPPVQLVPSGGGQTWYFSNPLPTPYEVVVRDANGRAVPGVTVTWAVATGGGSVSPATNQTDASGEATSTHTLGPSATSQSVTATVTNLTPATFSATAGAPPTSGAVSVRDNVFQPSTIAVQANGTITWTWQGADDHNVTFTGGPQPRPANSTTKITGTHSPAIPNVGRYDYTCTNHAGMNGTLHVVN